MSTWKNTPTKTIDVDGTPFAYRELGQPGGVPVVFLHHVTAVLDDGDPRVLDGVASQLHVVAFDNRGVGATGGPGRCTRLPSGTLRGDLPGVGFPRGT